MKFITMNPEIAEMFEAMMEAFMNAATELPLGKDPVIDTYIWQARAISTRLMYLVEKKNKEQEPSSPVIAPEAKGIN